ncbi:MAG: hypothetical protein V1773_11650 [bacterium]
MEEMLQNPEQLNELEEDEKFGHTDSIVGLFTEPVPTFEKIALLPPKTIDWLVPVVLLAIAVIFSNYLMFTNAQIKYSLIEKQMAITEKKIQELVDKGTITEKAADEQLEKIRKLIEKNMRGFSPIMIISTFISVFIKFFIVAGVFLIFAKFVLKGEGNYQTSMVALGLPAYITIVQVIFMVIFALALSKFLKGLSVSDFLDMDKSTYAGFFLSFLDPFSIWFFAIVSIAYAKLFKSTKVMHSFVTVFGLWIGFSVFLFLLAKYIPMFKMLGLG